MRNGTILAILMSALFLMSTVGPAISMQEDTEIMPTVGRDSSDIRISEILPKTTTVRIGTTTVIPDHLPTSSLNSGTAGLNRLMSQTGFLTIHQRQDLHHVAWLGTQPLRLMDTS